MPDDTRVVLFATASKGTPVLLVARKFALSFRPAQERPVAIVCLSAIDTRTPEPTSACGDLVLDEPWRVSMVAGSKTVLIHWAGSESEARLTEWVTAGVFSDLLKKLTGHFDLILVEAGTDPPPAPQQLALAPLCNGTVMLVRPGISTAAEVQSCETQLIQHGARFLGCIFVEGPRA